MSNFPKRYYKYEKYYPYPLPNLRKALKTKRDRVEYILERYPETRNSDNILMWYYLKWFVGIDLPFETVEKICESHVEGIFVCRRNIQDGQEGEYLAYDPEIYKKRRNASIVWREKLKGTSAASDIAAAKRLDVPKEIDFNAQVKDKTKFQL